MPIAIQCEGHQTDTLSYQEADNDNTVLGRGDLSVWLPWDAKHNEGLLWIDPIQQNMQDGG